METISNKLVVEFYKRIVPLVIRNRVTILRNAGGLDTVRRNIFKTYRFPTQMEDEEIRDVVGYLSNHPLRVFPYHFPD